MMAKSLQRLFANFEVTYLVENKEIIVNIDLRRIPRKMLDKPIPQQEEPDAWILSVSMPGSTCQNSV
jgi:hypothetical protein